MRTPNLTGQRFGKLTVIERADKIIRTGRKIKSWRCHCDCGRETTVYSNYLTRGRTLSCRCTRLGPTEERFWNNVSKVYSCWIWKGNVHQGMPRIGGNGTAVSARQLSLTIAGIKRPPNTKYMVKCGNSLCVNPEHLIPARRTHEQRKRSSLWMRQLNRRQWKDPIFRKNRVRALTATARSNTGNARIKKLMIKNSLKARSRLRVGWRGQIFKSAWEAIFAAWLNFRRLTWKYEPESFEYELNGKLRSYHPDFYIEEYGLFVELHPSLVRPEEMKKKINSVIASGKRIILLDEVYLRNIGLWRWIGRYHDRFKNKEKVLNDLENSTTDPTDGWIPPL